MSGATVEGSHSSQSFTTASFQGKAGAPTIIRLRMVGRKEPLTVTDTKKMYCVKCGKKSSFTDKFCSKCGVKLKHELLSVK